MELLEKYDVKLNDAILADEGGKHTLRMLRWSRTLPQYIAGGAGQNSCRSAVDAANPNSTAYFGCVSLMHTGSSSRRAAVMMDNVCYMKTDKAGTGTCCW